MKFLKVLVNSAINGLFFSALIALLTLDININLPFRTGAFGRLILGLAAPYGLAVVLASLLLFFIVQFFAGKKFSIRIVSPSFLSLSFVFLILFYLFIFWKNYHYFQSFFGDGIGNRLEIQAISLAVLALLAAATFYLSRRTKKTVLPFAAYFLVFALGMAWIILQRAEFPSLPGAASKIGSVEARQLDKNIILIGLEGLSFDFIIPLIQEGQLPNFSWLVDNGCWGRLGTLSPTESFILNRSLMTGKFPFKHRQLSLVSYTLDAGEYRLEVTPRYILFRQMTRLGLLKPFPNEFPPVAVDIKQIIEANGSIALNADGFSGKRSDDGDPKVDKAFNFFFKSEPHGTDRLLNTVRDAFEKDWKREEKASSEKIRLQPDFFHLLLDGLNSVEAYLFKYCFPELFGNIAQEDINKYGAVISRYYQFYDQLIGKYLASLKDDEILIIYSPYGVEPLPLWKRFVEWILGNSDISATHEDKPDGAFIIYGKGIAKKNPIEGMTIVDIVPTLLYFIGLPVGRDMDGIVQSSVFIPEFTAENPIFSISSYEEIEIKKAR